MVPAAALIDLMAADGLAALIGAPAGAVVVAQTNAQAHALDRGDEVELDAGETALIHSGRVVLYDEHRMDALLGPTSVAAWWIDRPTRVVALDPAQLVVVDREQLEAIRTNEPADLRARLEKTLEAVTDARERRDRLANRLLWPLGTDPLLQTRMPYAGNAVMTVYPVRPKRWHWGGERPDHAAVVVADIDSLAPYGEPPQPEADTKMVFVVSVIPADPDERRDAQLRVHACWSCRARSVRVGRELFDLPFQMGNLHRLGPSRRLFTARSEPRLILSGRPGAVVEQPFRTELGVPDGELVLVSRHRLPEGAVRATRVRSTSRMTVHTTTGRYLEGAEVEAFDINWFPTDPAGRAFRLESTFILQADPIRS